MDERSKNLAVDDRKFRSRLLLAFAFSIALHEVIAGLWPSHPKPLPETVVVSQVIKIVRPKPTPKPTPPPTPRPTPQVTPAPHYTLAPKIVVFAPAAKAAATPAHKLGGAAAPKRIVTPTPETPRPAPPVSLAEGAHAGQQNGGSGAGAGAGAGNGGLSGTGAGSGTAGTGNGGDANTAPCGTVEFIPGHFSYDRDGSMKQNVSVLVTLRDGETQSGEIPYPFVYPSEKENPFLHDDKLSINGGVFLQQPPRGSDVSQMPPAVQVVISHTDPSTGTTTFPDCPKSSK